jgi:hypothetical protein
MTTAKQKTKTAEVHLTAKPLPTDSTARATFYQSVAKTDEHNSTLQVFLALADYFTKNTRSFSEADFIYYAKPYDISAADIKFYFAKWTTAMRDLGKLEILVNGAYDTPTYLWNV